MGEIVATMQAQIYKNPAAIETPAAGNISGI